MAANYGINIDVKIKAGKLTNFNRVLDQTNNKIDKANARIKGFASLIPDSIKPLTQSFNDLSAVVTKANAAFNKSTLGTPQATQAARNLITANEEFNIGLEKRAKLLEKVTFEMKMQKLAQKGIRPATVSSTPFGPMPMMTVNNNPRIMRNIAASQAARQDTNFGFGLAGDPVAKSIRRNQEKREKLLKRELKVRQNILQVEKLSLGIASAEQSTKAFGVKGGQIGPALPQGFRLRQQFKEGGLFGMPGGMKSRIKGGVGSALIGGGFPALFGAGGISSAFGAVAGGAGGALAPGGGFAASIFATAIAAQIEQTLDFRKSIRELNKEMQQMGISSSISGSQVRQLGKSLGITKEEAVQTLQEFKRFGNDAVLIAKKFGGDSAKFEAFAGANTVQSALEAIKKINKDLTIDDELRFINSVRRKGVEATINQMLDEMLEKEKKLETANFGQGKTSSRKRPAELRREREQLKEINTENAELIDKLTVIRDKYGEIAIANELASYSIISRLEELNREFRKLNDIQFQAVEFSKTFGSAFSESFKGIVKGTMSVQDAFRNMFMRIADHFLDMAAQMMANSLQRGLLGFLGNMFGGGAAPLITKGVFDTGFDTGLLGFANGGKPPVGKPSIVGERGPELFVPNSAGTIIPNHAMGGSTNVTVNVDASGSNVEGDAGQAEQLGEAISQAIQAELIQQKRPGGILYS